MSEVLMSDRATAAEVRYDVHDTEYTAIFGGGTVWCRAIPHIVFKPVIVIK